jgi:hypothetical protein
MEARQHVHQDAAAYGQYLQVLLMQIGSCGALAATATVHVAVTDVTIQNLQAAAHTLVEA